MPFSEDWIVAVLLTALVLFSLARSAKSGFIPATARFFLFRGTGDEQVRDVMGIFQWQSTVLNLASFIVIALFGYFASEYYGIIPELIPGFAAWLIILGIIIISVTIRHLVCIVTGIFSNQEAVFRDYLHTVYQSYRFAAFFIFFIVIITAYTNITGERISITSGAVMALLLYLIRILRLFKIFINRNISIFYLILYLCALEILPVLIVIRFFSGLR